MRQSIWGSEAMVRLEIFQEKLGFEVLSLVNASFLRKFLFFYIPC